MSDQGVCWEDHLQKEPIWLPTAHSATKTPNPANPPQCGKPAKGVGQFAWSQRGFMKILGGRLEPRGDELVADQENVLCLSKRFPALHYSLHGSGLVPRDRGAASEPAASQLLKPSPACQQLNSQQVPSPALHRCSTGADQSLAAAPATQNSKLSSCRSKKYLHTAQKPSKSLSGRAPPSEKPYSAGMSKI